MGTMRWWCSAAKAQVWVRAWQGRHGCEHGEAGTDVGGVGAQAVGPRRRDAMAWVISAAVAARRIGQERYIWWLPRDREEKEI